MDLKKFKQDVMSDKTLAAKLQTAESFEDFIAIANKAGYDFTIEDFKNAVQEKKTQNSELSDSDLEAVAGGSSFWHDFWGGFKYGFVDPVGGISDVINYCK